MRILITADTVGGVWDHVVTLATELDRAEHPVLVAVIGRPSAGQLAQLPGGVRLEHRELRLEWMPEASRDLGRAHRWLADLARSWKADVVHLNQLAYAAGGFPAPTLVAVHSDVVSWFREVRRMEPPSEWAPYRRVVTAGLRAASVVVAPTRYQASLVRRHYGRRVDRVIHNGSPLPGSVSVRKEGIVLCAGRAWDEAKGVATLDRAIGLLPPATVEAHFLGDLESPEGRRYAPGRLTCHGHLSRAEVEAWMARASLYVAPSLYEPFGLAPLEAAQHGCALLLSDIGSFRELWGGCAAFFDPGDAGALAALVERLAVDHETRERIAATCRARALRDYTADRFGREYIALYQEFVALRSDTAPAGAPGSPPSTPDGSLPRPPRV